MDKKYCGVLEGAEHKLKKQEQWAQKRQWDCFRYKGRKKCILYISSLDKGQIGPRQHYPEATCISQFSFPMRQKCDANVLQEDHS